MVVRIEHGLALGVTLDDVSWHAYYYECEGDQWAYKLVDLGTVTVERADRERRFIRGTFRGNLAVLTGSKVRCGPLEAETWTVHSIYGTFRCAWGIL